MTVTQPKMAQGYKSRVTTMLYLVMGRCDYKFMGRHNYKVRGRRNYKAMGRNSYKVMEGVKDRGMDSRETLAWNTRSGIGLLGRSR